MEKGNDLNHPEISSEVEKVISEDMQIAVTFNEFFVNIVPSLKISSKENYETDVGNDNEPILNYINKFKNHPSIKVIKSRKKEEQTFNFNYISYDEVFNGIMKLQTATTTQQNDIPTKKGSIFGLLIFNILLCDLFYFLEGVALASYTDDTTPYTANKTNDLVIKEI